MKRTMAFVSLLALVLVSVTAHADPFEPVVRVTDLTGKAFVKIPGSDTFMPIESGKTYPYGSEIKTDKGSKVEIELSSGNKCELQPNAHMALKENKGDKKTKVAELISGKLTVNLEDNISESNGFQIETPSGICKALGGEVEAEVQHVDKQKMNVAAFKVNSGRAQVVGAHYKVPILQKGDALSASKSANGKFTRVKNLSGKFGLQVIGTDGEKKTVETEPGATAKIWRKRMGKDPKNKKETVTILITDADGVMVEALTRDTDTPVVDEEDKGVIDDDVAPFGDITGDDDDDDDDDDGKNKNDDKDDDDDDGNAGKGNDDKDDITSTVSSSTTTTVPPVEIPLIGTDVTPTGKR